MSFVQDILNKPIMLDGKRWDPYVHQCNNCRDSKWVIDAQRREIKRLEAMLFHTHERIKIFYQCIDRIDKDLGLELSDEYKILAYNTLREVMYKEAD